VRGFIIAFAVELITFAIIRATWNPSRDTLFILWVTLACALIAVATAELDGWMRLRRWHPMAVIVSPVLVFGATWLLFGGSYYLECGGVGSPFFDLGCD
jgi:hypothetical protein